FSTLTATPCKVCNVDEGEGSISECDRGHRPRPFHGSEKDKEPNRKLFARGSGQNWNANHWDECAAYNQSTNCREQDSPMPDEEHRRTWRTLKLESQSEKQIRKEKRGEASPGGDHPRSDQDPFDGRCQH